MAGVVRLSACLLGLCAAACGDGGEDERSVFVGTWKCNEGATVSATCPGFNVLEQLDESYTAEIQRDGKRSLKFTVQGSCSLRLDVEGGVARSASPGQPCRMLVGRAAIDAQLDTFELRPRADGTLENRASGTTKLRFGTELALDCEKFEFSNVVLSL